MTTPLASITVYRPWQSALFVFAVSFAVLWWNAAPSVTFHDSGEFAMAAASAGIPHPPGAPSWTILASAFIRLFGFEDPARGTNVFSGFCSAVTLALICWLVQRWALLLFPAVSRWIMALTGISASLILSSFTRLHRVVHNHRAIHTRHDVSLGPSCVGYGHDDERARRRWTVSTRDGFLDGTSLGTGYRESSQPDFPGPLCGVGYLGCLIRCTSADNG